MNYEDYQNYLDSYRWRRRRKKVIKRDDYECVVCGKCKKYGLHVHHESYKNLASKKPQDEIDDCITICEEHHKGLHLTLNYLKTGKFE